MVPEFGNGEIDFEDRKVALVDVEGTVTPAERAVPGAAERQDMLELLEGGEPEGDQYVGYWRGLNLLGGEEPTRYLERMKEWQSGELSREEFEEKNIQYINRGLELSEHGSPQRYLEWYNDAFLELRERAGELVEALSEAGFKVGIISHTSTSLSRLAAVRLDADFVVPTWGLEFEDGKFSWVDDTQYAHSKLEVEDDLRARGVEEIIVVGNGENDVELAENADRSFMVENEEEVDYDEVAAFTGSFDKILVKIKEKTSA